MMKTDYDLDTRPPAPAEIARELRRRRDRLLQGERLRRLTAMAYAIVADDLDEREHRARA